MKFLECDEFTELCALLNRIQANDHVIHARVEAFSCKTAGKEKRAAKKLERQLSEEAVVIASPLLTTTSELPTAASSAVASGAQATLHRPPSLPTEAASSVLPPLTAASGAGTLTLPPIARSASAASGEQERQPASLADIADPAVRKVLITLICTLNASYPDFDFSSAEPADFAVVRSADALAAIREHVSDAAEQRGGAECAAVHARLCVALNAQIDLSQTEVYAYACDIEESVLWSLNYFFFSRRQKKLVFFTAWATSRHRATDEFDSDDDGESDASDPDGR